jgi:phage/plasmid-like protein (TIGR03299 family)
MAHEITRTNGFDEMAYVGATPWHGLGQKLAAGANIDEWTVQAGMAWRVQRSKVRFATGRDQGTEQFATLDDQHVLMRSDTKAPLGIVSDRFQIVQPRQVLEFFRDLTEGAGFHLDTAGTLHGGRKFWALAKIGADAIIKDGRDKVGGYLLLATAADGTMATTGKYTGVRVVCNNTMSIALGHGKADAKISHRSKFDAEAMKDSLGIARDGFNEWARTMKMLAMERVGIDSAEQTVFTLLTDKDWDKASAEVVQEARETTGFKTIMALFNGGAKGSQFDGVKGTAWGLLNAVTEYTDHHIRARSQDNRLESAWFGPGDKLKAKALELLTA